VTVKLEVKRPPYVMPSYSLTGDLIAYLTCGLQYRYHSRGALPPSTPVQIWFGEFIHGVLEEAYLSWVADHKPFPWEWDPTIKSIEQHVDTHRLRPNGLIPPRNLYDSTGTAKRLASERAEMAINIWGSQLFPLVTHAELRLKGIRPLLPPGVVPRADYYEISGIADVLGKITLSTAKKSNSVIRSLESALGPLGGLEDEYEILVDYKGTRRPPLGSPRWKQFEWQIRTYAWLRQAQPDSTKVAGGIILFLNELAPSGLDTLELQKEVWQDPPRLTDVVPAGADLTLLRKWRRGAKRPSFSSDFLRRRSVHVVSVDDKSVSESLTEFDKVVWQIEEGVAGEMTGQNLAAAWVAAFKKGGNPVPKESDCTACDFKTYCPLTSQNWTPQTPSSAQRA
jgi:PD-(D/E)XK nuclease superfamily